MRDRVFGVLDNLPPDVDPPEVSKADADSQPILILWVRSDSRDLIALSRFADDVFVERLQTIPGVSRVDIWGEKRRDAALARPPAAGRLPPVAARRARRAGARERRAAERRIEGEDVELAVRTLSRLDTAEEFDQLILKEEGGRLVRFSDVGRAELGPRNERHDPQERGRADGRGGGAPAAEHQPHRHRGRVLPRGSSASGTTCRPTSRSASASTPRRFVRRSIREVSETIFIAFALVTLIIFAFLRDWRTTLIPVLAIPVSLIGAFFVMYVAGFSINVLTLLAVVLAIGLVVDDAIVVLENIYTKIEAGQAPMAAAVAGTREIFFAVISTTVTLVVVFLPLLLPRRAHRPAVPRVRGDARRRGGDLGVRRAHADADAREPPAQAARGPIPALPRHRAVLRAARTPATAARSTSFLGRRWLVWPLILVCLAVGTWMVCAPAEGADADRGPEPIRLNATGPEGATFEYMDTFMDQVSAVVADEVPERQAAIVDHLARLRQRRRPTRARCA